MRWRHTVGDRRVADLLLGTDKTLGHGRFGGQEGSGDLSRRQPGQGPQGQGDPRLQRQRGVATGEDEPEPIVWDVFCVHVGSPWVLWRRQQHRLLELGCLGRMPAQPVERPVTRHRCEPCPWPPRDPVARPRPERRREGVLRALLGQVPVAGHADQRGDDLAPFVGERIGDRRM
jgi:hypothetical protein